MRFREQRARGEEGYGAFEAQEEGRTCEEIEQAADRELLLDALGKLKEEERQVVLLYAAAGMKHREVARALNLPLATELSKYNRSMKRLRQILSNQME